MFSFRLLWCVHGFMIFECFFFVGFYCCCSFTCVVVVWFKLIDYPLTFFRTGNSLCRKARLKFQLIARIKQQQHHQQQQRAPKIQKNRIKCDNIIVIFFTLILFGVVCSFLLFLCTRRWNIKLGPPTIRQQQQKKRNKKCFKPTRKGPQFCVCFSLLFSSLSF